MYVLKGDSFNTLVWSLLQIYSKIDLVMEFKTQKVFCMASDFQKLSSNKTTISDYKSRLHL
jgi:hypothetical protein